uniref:Uncharacterized protein n=1 Tax=Meloidogyne enterolobii TaxID=390850 RepID=A0A6V7V606_MELEN|nr:unnamed protein product [Meloidogyne enterolobii]
MILIPIDSARRAEWHEFSGLVICGRKLHTLLCGSNFWFNSDY